ncbi:MAG: winged helix DNA-binding domain-containing protein [Defluviitaleaceae bacterium]|nr:winged helix DNA-binding domain-containing protein [Defluviitaleaceae bacterium]
MGDGITKQQARQFMLLKHGLLGKKKFLGKAGVIEFIRQVGCVQFDPVDICGKNVEIILQSRVSDFDKKMLAELLYEDRLLVDYPDKQLSIISVENWHYFERFREIARQGGSRFEGLAALEKEALTFIEANSAVSSAELPLEGSIDWHSSIHWSGNWNGKKTNAARAVLEQLYSTGELVIHHKKGTRKYYDLATRHIPKEILSSPDPLPDDFQHMKWRVFRRIGAVGLLWNKPSSAWLGIDGLKNNNRNEIFKTLIESGEITSVSVEGQELFYQSADAPIMEAVLNATEQKQKPFPPQTELIAPLDNLMWDRKLIRELFDFDYKWEIYTPEASRKYGAYTLPILHGDRFIGRADVSREAKTFVIKNIWLEAGVKSTKKLQAEISKMFARFAKFNHCTLTAVGNNAI